MNKKTKATPKKITQLLLGIIPILVLIITFSCEEDPSSLGSDLLPNDTKLTYRYDTSFTFSGNVLNSDTIFTSNLTYYSLGIIDDNTTFGTFTGEFAGQFLPLIRYDKDSIVANFNVDSVILFLSIDSIYGNAISDLSFTVYELNKELDDDYYSDENISNFYSTSEIISSNCIFSGDTLIKITLSNEFANKLIPENEQDTSYKNFTNFLSVYDGIAIIPNLLNSPGGIFTIDITSFDSKILLYHDDTLSFTYNLTGNRFTEYTPDYIGSAVDNNESDQFMFLQGLNGLSSKITLSNISSWLQGDSSYSVLNAELFVPIFKDDNFDLFTPPEKLFIEYNNSDSTLYEIKDYEDYKLNRTYIFDGSYDSENGYYHFYIPKHIMNLLNGEISDFDLQFNFESKLFYPNRVIFKSSDNIKLNITYTKH